ncbi:HAD family phosphatase [Acetobacteraceae bacterium ESL0709]|nr:HAD family phosphatase [Acetobacteraceae bacterium ESL0697]MDF7677110.1 HAD family phosphatase [Acetobacteraceae bacterium ESL0709]
MNKSSELRSGLKLVVFDCDGVLIDSEGPSCRKVAEYARSLGIKVSDKEAFSRYAGNTIAQTVSSFEKELGHSLPPETVPQMRHMLVEFLKSGVDPIDGAFDLLEDLKKHHIPFSVGSNSSIVEMEAKFGHTKMDRLIPKDRIFSANDMGCHKPDPGVYLHAAQQEGVTPEETIVIEDSDTGAEAVRRAGMSCLLLRDHNHSLPSYWPVPHFVHITSLSEVMPLLLPKLAPGVTH